MFIVYQYKNAREKTEQFTVTINYVFPILEIISRIIVLGQAASCLGNPSNLPLTVE